MKGYLQLKDFNYWKKLHESEQLEEFSENKTALLWLKTKSIIRKELLTDFTSKNGIVLLETSLAKQFVELFDKLSKDISSSHTLLDNFIRVLGS